MAADYLRQMVDRERSRGDDLRQAIKGQVRHPYITGQGLGDADLDEADSNTSETGLRRSCHGADAHRDTVNPDKDSAADEELDDHPHPEHPFSQDSDV
ncbi:MAG: hypothetical protein HOM68_06415 [Gemmatimonadetes bacterium]|nr:hypothetical protein [Gemmatimonadota bacterium]MBT4608686.1 hypothetical protein [Gemmatimonadota bacterium]MBT5056153.1 hypothetical protein [Gemmatimonadota bacterium]MBT5142597.1 hypothetical protein [Gemmatimonadota bacterium]MBT5592190.1 hypothetical protein [Gemmatimonadota bacterium]